MATIKLQGSAGGGSVTLTAPVTATNTTVTFPAQDVNLGQVATLGTTYSTPTRAGSNTVHQNTGTTFRIVMIDASGSNGNALSMSSDSTTWYQVYYWSGNNGVYERASATLIVPPGHYWRYSGSGAYGVVEIS